MQARQPSGAGAIPAPTDDADAVMPAVESHAPTGSPARSPGRTPGRTRAHGRGVSGSAARRRSPRLRELYRDARQAATAVTEGERGPLPNSEELRNRWHARCSKVTKTEYEERLEEEVERLQREAADATARAVQAAALTRECENGLVFFYQRADALAAELDDLRARLAAGEHAASEHAAAGDACAVSEGVRLLIDGLVSPVTETGVVDPIVPQVADDVLPPTLRR